MFNYFVLWSHREKTHRWVSNDVKKKELKKSKHRRNHLFYAKGSHQTNFFIQLNVDVLLASDLIRFEGIIDVHSFTITVTFCFYFYFYYFESAKETIF